MADQALYTNTINVITKNRVVLLLIQLLSGFFISFLVIKKLDIIIVLICILPFILLYFYKDSLALLSSLILPVATLTGFIDIPILRIPTFETPLGIFLNTLSLLTMLLITRLYFSRYDIVILKPFISYALILILSSLLSVDPYRSFAFVVKTYLPVSLLCILLFKTLKYTHNRKIFEYVFVVTYFVIFAVSFYQFIINGLGFTEAYRASDNVIELKNLGDNIRVASLFKHTYAFAEFNMFAFPFVYCRYLSTTYRYEKYLSATIGLMILITTVWTQQRTGLAIIFLQLASIYLLVNRKKFSGSVFKTAIKTILIFSIFFVLALKTEYGQTLITRMVNTFINPTEITRDIGSTLQRIWRIKIAWEIFKDFPVLGSGLATSPELFDKHGWDYVNAAGGPHNLFLLLLSETGLLGFITFAYAWLSVFVKIYKSRVTSIKQNISDRLPAIIFMITILLDGLFTGLLSGISITILFIFISYSLSILSTNTLSHREFNEIHQT